MGYLVEIEMSPVPFPPPTPVPTPSPSPVPSSESTGGSGTGAIANVANSGKEESSTILILVGCLITLFLVFLVLIVIFVYRKRKQTLAMRSVFPSVAAVKLSTLERDKKSCGKSRGSAVEERTSRGSPHYAGIDLRDSGMEYDSGESIGENTKSMNRTKSVMGVVNVL